MDKFTLWGRAEYRDNGAVVRVTPWQVVGLYSCARKGDRLRAFGYAEKKMLRQYADATGVEITSRVY
jgi:hypothetical protein